MLKSKKKRPSKNPGKKILSNLYDVERKTLQQKRKTLQQKRKTLQQIADIYGVTRECVRQWMEELHLPRDRPGIKSILDESNLIICDKYIKGEPVVKLAKKHRVCKVTIYKFLLECNPSIGLEKKRFREKSRSN